MSGSRFLRSLLGLLILSGPTTLAEFPPTVLSTFGSRLTVIPEETEVRLLPWGTFFPELSGLRVTLTVGSERRVFPSRPGEPGFPQRRVQVTDTSIRIAARDPGFPVELIWHLRAPFDPSEAAEGLLPAMELQLEVRNRSPRPQSVRTEIRLVDQQLEQAQASWPADLGPGVVLSVPLTTDNQVISVPVPPRALAQHLRAALPRKEQSAPFPVRGTCQLALSAPPGRGWQAASDGLVCSASLGAGTSRTDSLVLAFRCPLEILRFRGHPCRLSRGSVAPMAELVREFRRRLPRLERQDRAFRRALGAAAEDSPHAKLRHLALQSFFANTWCLAGEGERPVFLVWEGRPRFLSTLDVEFNNALFLARFVPRALALELALWPRFLHQGHMPHDVGKGLVAEGTRYPVSMAVEEDANYVLLHLLFQRCTGDPALSQEQAAAITGAVRRILESDTDGDGLPDRSVYTTLDDAPPAIGAARNGLYLGIKASAALQAARRLPLELPSGLAERVEARLDAVDRTVRALWRGDHLPACQGAQGGGVGVLIPVDPRSHAERKPEGPPPVDCETPSNVLAHGLLPLLVTGQEIPAEWSAMLRSHLAWAAAETDTPYGTAHTRGVRNLWISQCLWRDLCELYLGGRPDMDRRLRQYWALQIERQRDEERRWDLFCDSPENEFLTSYSRGACIAGLTAGHHRLSVDLAAGRITAAPGAAGDCVPIPECADWTSARVPYLVWDPVKRCWAPEAESRDLLQGIQVRTR